MTKPLEFHGVEAEKAEAMRRYNYQKRFRSIVRAAAVAFLGYLWLPTVGISLQAAGDWFYRTGAVIVTDRTFVFVFANILVAFIFLLSRDRDEESTTVEPDLYDQYTSSSSSSAVTVTASDEKVVDGDDSKKQIVPAFTAEVDEVVDAEVVAGKQIVPAFIAAVDEEVVAEAVTEDSKGICRRTKSETKKKVIRPVTEFRRTESERKKENIRPVTEFRRTESANSAIERLSSEEFRLKVEAFIMEKKMNRVQEENGVVEWQEDSSSRLGANSGYGSC